MILLLTAWASSGLEERAAAARLRVDDAVFVDVEAVQVDVLLVDGLPWLQVRNDGQEPLSIRWTDSLLTPPNGQPSAVLPLVRAQHDPVAPLEPIPDSTVAPGDAGAWAVFPLDWVDDGLDDAEQIAAWTTTSFSGLELRLVRGEQEGSYTGLWRTEIDVDALRSVDLALPAQPVEPVVPVLAPVDLTARREWDNAYRTYRQQARTARSIWVTSTVVGGLCALGALGAAQGMQDAPVDGPDERGRTRQQYQSDLLVYGGLALGSVGVTVPMVLWERKSTERLRSMGPRP